MSFKCDVYDIIFGIKISYEGYNLMDSEDSQEYIQLITGRSKKLIKAKVWNEISLERLNNWMGALRNLECELAGAFLLDNLSYRSRAQYESLLDTIFYDLKDENNNLLLDTLVFNEHSVDTVFVPVIGLESPPTKSGPYILRLIQKRYRIKNCWLEWPNSLKGRGSLKQLYFVDDFCGTGDQFRKFVKSIDIENLKKIFPDLEIYYLVTTAHEKGIKKITELFPYINIKYSELLTKEHSIFSEPNLKKYNNKIFTDTVKDTYDRLITETGIKARSYGKLDLAYAFHHATPNNSLPLLWNETDKLPSLLDR
jgi:hypothetical protein